MNNEYFSGLVDSHIHSRFSKDSQTSFDNLCEMAIVRGLSGICITDHVEHNPTDIGFGKYRAQEYFDEVKRAREKYDGKLEILSGCEFSEPHLYPAQFEKYFTMPYDSIIGSVHYWIGDLRVEYMVKTMSLDEVFEPYWKSVRSMVEFGGVNVLGHLDFPKRYFGDISYSDEYIFEIFKLAYNNAIVPEINTSSIRCGMEDTMPSATFLDIYAKAGGTNVVLGSDAHCSKYVGAGFHRALKEAKRFSVGFFRKRKFATV